MTNVGCFDLSRCCGNFSVYFYPHTGLVAPNEWSEALTELALNAPYSVSDPTEACLLVPNLGAFQCCQVSRQQVTEELRALPHWNGDGRNHAVLDYRDWYWQDRFRDWASYDIDSAISLKSSMPTSGIRHGFDVSLPFPRRTFLQTERRDPGRKRLLAAYMGSGSVEEGEPEIRRQCASLHSLEHGVIALDTSRTVSAVQAAEIGLVMEHLRTLEQQAKPTALRPVVFPFPTPVTNSVTGIPNFAAFLHSSYVRERLMRARGGDPVSARDVVHYDDLMTQARYALIPRGYGLHTHRLFEALAAGAVPVILVDDYVLPFADVLPWDAFSVRLPEADHWRVVDVLESIPYSQWLAMQRTAVAVYEEYFVSKEAVLHHTLMMLRDRVEQAKRERSYLCSQ